MRAYVIAMDVKHGAGKTTTNYFVQHGNGNFYTSWSANIAKAFHFHTRALARDEVNRIHHSGGGKCRVVRTDYELDRP